MKTLGLAIVALTLGWLNPVCAKPLVVELTVFDARTATVALGNIAGTSATFRVASDTQFVTVDGTGAISFPAASIDVTVLGTPIGTIHGVINMSDMRVLIASGEIQISMPVGNIFITQGIRAQVAALNGYLPNTALPSSPAQFAVTYVDLPVSGRLYWTPDIAGVSNLGAGGISNPGGTLAISILEPSAIPASSPASLLLLALMIVLASWMVARLRVPR
jgi:hypothetical protein